MEGRGFVYSMSTAADAAHEMTWCRMHCEIIGKQESATESSSTCMRFISLPES